MRLVGVAGTITKKRAEFRKIFLQFPPESGRTSTGSLAAHALRMHRSRHPLVPPFFWTTLYKSDANRRHPTIVGRIKRGHESSFPDRRRCMLDKTQKIDRSQPLKAFRRFVSATRFVSVNDLKRHKQQPTTRDRSKGKNDFSTKSDTLRAHSDGFCNTIAHRYLQT
ncbi:hypothetical protein L596_025207 [Steinernema carpocapsae]|uniref:Uncharacterized protein n=1 Tax=Steinernema carpocapsae TaxID=34508 RepID=A0A4U5M741_STECR|nr:hypothetical protein L596_025207 [Steinernema carpocapsae]